MSRRALVAVVLTAVLIACVGVYLLTEGANQHRTKRRSLTSIMRLGELRKEYVRKRWQGYDVFKAREYMVRARQAYKHGDKSKAKIFYRLAVKSLKNVPLLPKIRLINRSLSSNNVQMKRIPTVHDFVPLGEAYVMSENGYLAYPSNDLRWKLSCFIYVAYGKSKEGGLFVYQGRNPFTGEGPHVPKIYMNGRWIAPFPMFHGPLYYNESSNTVYNYDASHTYVETLTYNPSERLWVHQIRPLNGSGPWLRIVGRAEGRTFWLGDWGGPFLIHGVTVNKRDLDVWGGFWDVGEMNAELHLNDKSYTFYGYFLMDRAGHLTYYYRRAVEGGSTAPVSFSCMFLCQKEFCLIMDSTTNPSPLKPPVPFEHQARINFRNGTSFPLTEFELKDDGCVQPSKFVIRGNFSEGYVNLIGEAFIYWPEKWFIRKGAWWDPEGCSSWGRAVIHWTGNIVLNGRVIEVDAYGLGEFTRYSSVSCHNTTG